MSGPLRRVLGRFGPSGWIRAWLTRHPWLKRFLWLAPVLLLLALLGPALGVLERLLALLGRLLSPLVDTGPGRIVLAVLLACALLGFAWTFLKGRVEAWLRRHALRHHLDGLERSLMGAGDRGAASFRRVLALGRWVDLSKGEAAAHGDLAAAARLELARIHFERGRIEKAAAELARLPKSRLSPTLARSWAVLQASVAAADHEALPGARRAVLAECAGVWPEHPEIACLYAAQLAASGGRSEAVQVLRRCLKAGRKAPGGPAARARVRENLAELLLEEAEEGLAAGDLAAARKACKAALEVESNDKARLLLLDIQLAAADLDAALDLVAQLPLPAARRRLRAVLSAGAGELDFRRVLEKVPRRDVLLLYAEQCIRAGDFERARRTLEVLRRSGPLEPKGRLLEVAVEITGGDPETALGALAEALSLPAGGSLREGGGRA